MTATFTLESAYGSVTPLNVPEDFDALISEAMDAHADRVVVELTKPSSTDRPRHIYRT